MCYLGFPTKGSVVVVATTVKALLTINWAFVIGMRLTLFGAL